VGTNDAAESADDATVDPAKCSVPVAVEYGYAAGSRYASATSSTTSHWKSRKNKGKDVNTTTSKGRVYSLDGKKAQANEDLISGMCFLG